MIKVWGWKCDVLHEVGMGKVEERIFEEVGGEGKTRELKR